MQVNIFSSQDLSCPTTNFSTPSISASSSSSSSSSQRQQQQQDEEEVNSFLRLSARENNNLCKDVFTFTTSTNAQSLVPMSSSKEKRLHVADHHKHLMEAANQFCISKEFVDLHIQCDDGVMAAHRLVLVASSPFLKSLISDLDQMAEPSQPLLLVLPDVKVTLVQTLLEFLYTGQVTAQEEQFYSLMKLVYDLDISASIDAEKTSALPTRFQTLPVVVSAARDDYAVRPRKRARLDTFESTISVLLEESTNHHNVELPTGTKTVTSLQQQQLWQQKPLAVNSLTASGVEVKQEPEEKPLCEDDSVEQQQPGKNGNSLMRAGSYCLSGSSAQSTNSANNNSNSSQLGHFVSVSPGYQVKLELTNSSAGHNANSNSSQQQQSAAVAASVSTLSSVSKDAANPDDPLAAIMNQTIFGGDIGTMFIQVNSNGAPFLSTTQKMDSPSQRSVSDNTHTTNSIQPGNSNKARQRPHQHLHHHHHINQEEDEDDIDTEEDSNSRPIQQQQQIDQQQQQQGDEGGHQDGYDELACGDEDLNTNYNCGTCNRVMKGKVMLQAHQYQEHHENPNFEATNFPENKYACRVCLKLFTRNSDVKAHILRVHCGDRRYPCTLCGKRFKESTHLRKHLYTHTGERPHFCSYCSKGFQTSSDLKRHKKTRVHQERVDQCNTNNTTPTESQSDKSLNTSIDFSRWPEADDEDLESALNSAAAVRAPSSSPSSFHHPVSSSSSSGQQAPATSQTIFTMSSNHHHSPSSPANNPNIIFTTAQQQQEDMSSQQPAAAVVVVSQSPRITNSTLVFSNVTMDHDQFVVTAAQAQDGNSGGVVSGLHKNGSDWPGVHHHHHHGDPEDLLGDGQNLHDTLVGGSPPLGDVVLSQNQLSLSGTTLDLSDIKWGILEPAMVAAIKRSASSDLQQQQQQERLTMPEEL